MKTPFLVQIEKLNEHAPCWGIVESIKRPFNYLKLGKYLKHDANGGFNQKTKRKKKKITKKQGGKGRKRKSDF